MSRSGLLLFRRCLQETKMNLRKLTTKLEENPDEPLKFSTSPAAQRRVIAPIRRPLPTAPWYQMYCVTGSVAVFLIYFCILREENDIDQEFDKTLYDRVHGMEKFQLLQTYRYNKEEGLPVDDIEKRLKELDEAEAAATS